MKRGDVCYGMLRAAACVDESDHHALMYVVTELRRIDAHVGSGHPAARYHAQDSSTIIVLKCANAPTQPMAPKPPLLTTFC